MKQTKRFVIAILVTLLVLTGCSKGGTSGAGDIDLIGDVGGDNNTTKMENGLEVQEEVVMKTIEDSFYFSQFGQEELVLVNEIKSALNTMESKVVLSSSLSENDLIRIMNIIWLDEPKYFFVARTVDYSVEGDSKIRELSFTYEMDSLGEVQTALDTINKRVSPYGNDVSTTYKVFLETIESVVSSIDYCQTNNELKTFKGNAANTIAGNSTGFSSDNCMNSQGIAQYTSYALRLNGVEAMNVYGDITSGTYKDNGYDIPKANLDINSMSIIEDKGDGHRSYSLNANSLYGWNIVKLNNHYYNVDALYNLMATEDIIKSPSSFEPVGLLSTDLMTSLSKTSFISEGILGVRPAAVDYNFNILFRADSFVDKSNSRQVTTKVMEILEKTLFQKQEVLIQFETPENYNYFKDNVSSMLENLSKTTGEELNSPLIEYLPDVLVAKVSLNVVSKDN